jgi:ABC-type maltose transport system permease subunit
MSSTTTTATSARVASRAERVGQVSPNRRFWQAIQLVIVLLGCVYALVPIIIVISASLDPSNSLSGQGLLPRTISFDNYQQMLTDAQHPFIRWIGNSLFVSGVSTLITLTLCALAAYSLSRFRYKGRRFTMISILVVQVFPNLLAAIAIYLLLLQLGKIFPTLGIGLDSFGGLILVYCGGALGFNTWLMKGYFDTIPRELDESAQVDGATPFQTFTWIILPLIRPILAVVGILSFIGTYSDFLIAKVLLKNSDVYTFAVGLSLYIDKQYGKQWGIFAAAVLVGAVPIVIMYLLVQKQISGGLVSGAVKG